MARAIDILLLKDITMNLSSLVKSNKALVQGKKLKDIFPKLAIVG
jgi:hypothetical protein